MLCVAAARDEVVYDAVPLDSTTVPNSVVPSKNCTDPVGVPAAKITVAVNVTALVMSMGFALATKFTDADAWVITMVCVMDVAAE